MLEQPERHLNRHLRGDTLAAGSDRRPELPLPYRFNRLLRRLVVQLNPKNAVALELLSQWKKY